MVIELSVGGLVTLLGLPTAITAFCFWLLQQRITKRDKAQEERERAREKNQVLSSQGGGPPSLWGRLRRRPSSASRTHTVTVICTPPWNMPARSSMNTRNF